MDQPAPSIDGQSRHPGVQHLLDLFAYGHLPAGQIRDTSALCWSLARDIATCLGDGPELSAGLRKLLEAKDCFVRQAVIDNRLPRTCAEAGDRCNNECTVNADTGVILDPDCFRTR